MCVLLLDKNGENEKVEIGLPCNGTVNVKEMSKERCSLVWLREKRLRLARINESGRLSVRLKN